MEYKEIYELLDKIRKAKNADYGDSFGKTFREFGMIAPVVRIADKVERLKAISSIERQVEDETIDDTLLDLANYAIMTFRERSYERDRLGMDEANLEALR